MSLKTLLKQNLVLVVGLTLPLLLIVLFFVASVLPKSMATPPQYEMLFTTAKYEAQPPDHVFDLSVKDRHLMVKARKNDQKDRVYQSVRLMAYDGRSETVREIPLDTARIVQETSGEAVPLPETKGWQIDPASVAPDGYVLDAPNYGSYGLLGGLFGGSYRNNEYRLKKGGVGYKVPTLQPGNYYYGQLQFIGWVVSK
jgi:hypothetical protein